MNLFRSNLTIDTLTDFQEGIPSAFELNFPEPVPMHEVYRVHEGGIALWRPFWFAYDKQVDLSSTYLPGDIESKVSSALTELLQHIKRDIQSYNKIHGAVLYRYLPGDPDMHQLFPTVPSLYWKKETNVFDVKLMLVNYMIVPGELK